MAAGGVVVKAVVRSGIKVHGVGCSVFLQRCLVFRPARVDLLVEFCQLDEEGTLDLVADLRCSRGDEISSSLAVALGRRESELGKLRLQGPRRTASRQKPAGEEGSSTETRTPPPGRLVSLAEALPRHGSSPLLVASTVQESEDKSVVKWTS
jgi:hypothetical protein